MKATEIHIKRMRYVVACVIFVHLMSTSMWGATVTWDGGATKSDWFGVGGKGNNGHNNWLGDTPPTNGDSLVFQESLKLSNTNNISDLSVASITFSSGAGAFILGGNALTLTGNITNNSTSLQTISMDLGLSAGDHIIAATSGNITISGNVSGAGANLIKTGSNQLNLTGTASYTGNTTVSEGTLSFSNSFSVASGSTMGGAGTVALTGSAGLTINGKIAPGNGTTPGTLTFNLSSTTGGVTMSSGSGFEFHLGTAGLSMNNVGVSDMLAIVGAAAGNLAFNSNNINFLGTGQVGFYKLFDTSTNNANTWTGLTVDTSGQITAGLTYSNLASGYTATFHMGGYSMGGTTGDIYVQVIPEPNTTLLGGLGVISFLLRRRRH